MQKAPTEHWPSVIHCRCARLQRMSPPSTEPNALASLLKAARSFASLAFTAVRKSPVILVSVLVLALLYYRNPQTVQDQDKQNMQDTDTPEFSQPSPETEQKPPAELSPGEQSLWLCVQRVDAELIDGLWSDIYDGMEAKLDGTAITVKVTEKWQELSDTKRQAVGQLVVDTWLKTAQTLQVLQTSEETDAVVLKASGQQFQEVRIQRWPDDAIVAIWKPGAGLELFEPQVGV